MASVIICDTFPTMPRPRRIHRQLNLASLGLPEVPVLAYYHQTVAGDGLPPHAHPDTFEICCLAAGTQVYRVGGRDACLAAGDCFITLPREVHDTHDQPQGRGELHYFHLRPPHPGQPWLGLAPPAAAAVLADLCSLPRRHFPGPPGLSDRLAAILNLAGGPDRPRRSALVANRLAGVVLDLIDAAAASTATAEAAGMQRVLDHIAGHLDERLPVARLAAVAGLSVPWFKTRFRAAVGLPPAEYVLRRKVDRAVQLLGDGRRSVTAVAMDLGFPSSQHFAQVIRAYTGRRPSDFRPVPRP
jgi:AraC-like DNA-binding protein